MCKKIHVAKAEKNGWVVREGRKIHPTHTFKVKTDAIRAARKMGHSGGFVVIHNANGEISEVRRYKSATGNEKVRVQSAPVKSRLSKQDIYRVIATVEMESAAG